MPDDVTVHELSVFQFADLPEGYIALMLGYATSQEALSRREFETFVIGLSRDRAAELGRALIEKSGVPAAEPTTKPTPH